MSMLKYDIVRKPPHVWEKAHVNPEKKSMISELVGCTKLFYLDLISNSLTAGSEKPIWASYMRMGDLLFLLNDFSNSFSFIQTVKNQHAWCYVQISLT